MGRRPDDFPPSVVRQVEREVRATCSICGRPTVGPGTEAGKLINVGTAAHITAASKGGPRYDPTMSREERRSSSNALHTCRDCGKLVDDEPSTFNCESLRYLKAAAMARCRQAVISGSAAVSYVMLAEASRHDTARRIAVATSELEAQRRYASHCLERWRKGRTADAPASLERLRERLRALFPLIHEVVALWDNASATPVEALACDIDLFCIFMKDILDEGGDEDDSMLYYLFDERSGADPTVRLAKLVTIVQDWSAYYLGKPGASELAGRDLARRTWIAQGVDDKLIEQLLENAGPLLASPPK